MHLIQMYIEKSPTLYLNPVICLLQWSHLIPGWCAESINPESKKIYFTESTKITANNYDCEITKDFYFWFTRPLNLHKGVVRVLCRSECYFEIIMIGRY